MCFKNLPIEFDESGQARLRDGAAGPYSITVAPPKGYVRRQPGIITREINSGGCTLE